MPSIAFQLKPYKLTKIDARFWMDLGGQRITYNHGPKFWKELAWSGEDENKRVRIVFEDLDENRHEVSFDGPWAWFRLQDTTKLKKTNKTNVYLVTYSVDGKVSGGNKVRHSIQMLIKAKSVNNPFSANLLASFKTPGNI